MIILYHNSLCSKSNTAKYMLAESGHEYQEIHYLEEPPSPELLMQLLEKGDFSITDLVRFSETEAKELGLDDSDDRTDKEWFDIISNNPQILQRPIVETATVAVIGRPVDNVARLLGSL